MIELITGAIIALVCLLVGHTLGKNQTLITTDTKRQINSIFKRVVKTDEVGGVQRPDARQNYFRDNPNAQVEEDTMNEELGKLQ